MVISYLQLYSYILGLGIHCLARDLCKEFTYSLFDFTLSTYIQRRYVTKTHAKKCVVDFYLPAQ